ncbi:hypothetical protein LX32DRAFT_348332 [Colletotrichum zoysiae]|uniref:Uncharacterized protein n=1 Tax=Colletotrichum zoysiae TaxID=1216348 RepID=A0AAD9LTZ4_9PEZI|nr:hypothetical protein LX32DRAFT_348332 [Colletotrichum zoysiae]
MTRRMRKKNAPGGLKRSAKRCQPAVNGRKIHLFSFPLLFLQIAHATRQNRPFARRNRRRAKLRGKNNTLRDAIEPSRIKRQSKTASSISAAF